MFSRSFRAFVLAAVAAAAAFAPSESLAKGKAGTMEIVGKSGVSAQMVSGSEAVEGYETILSEVDGTAR